MHNSSFDLEGFIREKVTERKDSLFAEDLKNNEDLLAERINDQSVLVIGGAGTIGSSYIKALLKFKPSRLYVVDTNENGLTELTRDLRSSTQYFVPKDYKTYPMNFGDPVFEKLLRNEGPFDIVANFAAHKHVRSEKDHYAIEAMLENNVVRAKRLLDLLLEQPPKHFFCVSTDKAANPVNVMGASKKMMEEVILAYAQQIPISTARFANVAFSNGSLLFGFMERLMKRQPFSGPSDIKRYFVSPQESGELCLLACILGKTGDIFFPKLNEGMMKTFSYIGSELLKALGYQVDYCQTEEDAREKATQLSKTSSYPVYFFQTDTSGEKPFEEFFTPHENVNLQQFKALGVIKGQASYSIQQIETTFKELNAIFKSPNIDKTTIVDILSKLVPTFQHIEKGKNLDDRM